MQCSYKQSTTFPDEVFIEVKVEEVRGARLRLMYIMENTEGKTVCEASSEHCFLDKEGHLIRLERKQPELYRLLCDLAEK